MMERLAEMLSDALVYVLQVCLIILFGISVAAILVGGFAAIHF